MIDITSLFVEVIAKFHPPDTSSNDFPTEEVAFSTGVSFPDLTTIEEFVAQYQASKPKVFKPVDVWVGNNYYTLKSKEDLIAKVKSHFKVPENVFQTKNKVLWPNCIASVYGLNGSEGNTGLTASGTTFDPWNTMGAAVRVGEYFNGLGGKHVFVKNLANGKEVKVKIIDNGGLPEACIDLQALPASKLGVPDTYAGGPGGKIDVSVSLPGSPLTVDQQLNSAFEYIKIKK